VEFSNLHLQFMPRDGVHELRRVFLELKEFILASISQEKRIHTPMKECKLLEESWWLFLEIGMLLSCLSYS
jgi:hypothetical protein